MMPPKRVAVGNDDSPNFSSVGPNFRELVVDRCVALITIGSSALDHESFVTEQVMIRPEASRVPKRRSRRNRPWCTGSLGFFWTGSRCTWTDPKPVVPGDAFGELERHPADELLINDVERRSKIPIGWFESSFKVLEIRAASSNGEEKDRSRSQGTMGSFPMNLSHPPPAPIEMTKAVFRKLTSPRSIDPQRCTPWASPGAQLLETERVEVMEEENTKSIG